MQAFMRLCVNFFILWLPCMVRYKYYIWEVYYINISVISLEGIFGVELCVDTAGQVAASHVFFHDSDDEQEKDHFHSFRLDVRL